MKWLLLLLAGPALAQPALRERVAAPQEMVVTANPLATRAALDVLGMGGNAIDAAIAAHAVLGLVEPQATGVGGGGFALIYDPKFRELMTLDGRETAPASADPRLFLGADGQPLPFNAAVRSGRSVGVPGAVALWTRMAGGGRLKLSVTLSPARTLATEGFPIGPRLADAIRQYREPLAVDPAARAYFLLPDGSPKPAGTILTNPDYADLLDRIGREGPSAFYEGPVAAAIAAAVQGDTRGPGGLTVADLAGYQVIERVPVCGPVRALVVCGMGPPSSGGIGVLQILSLLPEGLPGPDDVQTVHAFLQANRLAFADRNLFVADPAFVSVPVAGLIDPAYLARRAALVGAGPIGPGPAQPGAPASAPGGTADASPPRFGGTSHVSVVDRFGITVSQTMTVESPFGNFRMVSGFLLNNELTDFSFDPGPEGAPVANRVQGGKRPRSSMAPTIVLTPEGAVRFVAGSPGGASIIGTTAQALMGMMMFGLDPQQAANQAHFQNNNVGPTTLESLYDPAATPGAGGPIGGFDVRSLAGPLRALGWTVPEGPAVLVSGLSLIRAAPGGWEGGADPRREGLAAGR